MTQMEKNTSLKSLLDFNQSDQIDIIEVIMKKFNSRENIGHSKSNAGGLSGSKGGVGATGKETST